MKQILCFLFAALLAFAPLAHAGGGTGWYQHFNGTVKFFPQGNNGQAWTFLYTTPPPVVPPVTPPVTPPTTPPTTPPAEGAPKSQAQQGKKASKATKALRFAVKAAIAGVAIYVAYCLITEDTSVPEDQRTCKRTPEPVDEYGLVLVGNTTNLYARNW